MRNMIFGLTAAALLAGCSDDGANPPKEEAKADALKPGEYEISAKVDTLRSTDGSAPATALKPGAPATVTRTCIPADGTIDPAAFAEAADTCTASDSYMRGGRMNLQLKCTRSGKGQLMQMVDGNFTADSFTGTVLASTYFSGPGDYELARTITGKRVGECPAISDEAAAEKKA